MINAAKEAEMECKVAKSHKVVRKKINRCRHPKWYEENCTLAFRNVQKTSKLLKTRPNDPYLRGLLSRETKFYNKLIKQKQSEFTKNIFKELDNLESKDPRAYYELIKQLRYGDFDKHVSEDSAINPQEWMDHFKSILGKPPESSLELEYMIKFVQGNKNLLKSELDDKI